MQGEESRALLRRDSAEERGWGCKGGGGGVRVPV